MDWDAISAVSGAIGAAAVVISLIYLAIQIRENSTQLRLSSILSINSLMNEAFDPIYNNEKNMLIWTTGLQAPEKLDESDMEIFLLFMARLMNPFETVVAHKTQQVLADESFDRYVRFFNEILKTPGGQHWLNSGRVQLSQSARQTLGIDGIST